MIPKHPFELTIFHHDSREQRREYETLDTAVEAAHSLRPAQVRGYKLVMILEYKTIGSRPPGNMR